MSFDRIVKLLLVFVPVALFLELTGGSPTVIFIVAALGIIPLADLIGEATEELAHHTGPKIGGLLNATLGNAAELIITILAIQAGLLELVKASIVGSIIGNLLLVMGLALLLGGWKNGVQKFDPRTSGLNATLLILGVVALVVPSLFDVAIQDNKAAEFGLSEGVAIVMIVLYGLSLLYAFTHAHPETAGAVTREAAVHESKWSVRTALIILGVSTLGIVFMSEALVGAVEHVTESLGLSEFFIGIIIIPLVGNIAEHLVAVQVAIKNKMELSMAVSVGSSLQIALFVAPVLVFITLLMTGEPLLLVFSSFELIAMIATVLVAAFIALDGESNWLEGAMLLAVYIILAIAFFYLPSAGGTVPHP
ncbi:MAG: calcium/proton exchanger [Anaerolineae bacterium]|nr:calcium/proton exchanger [Anaerolineae bacterium]MBN8618503.1 calcium/proton exchanger [Anaerolineae bacterium]